MAYAEHVGEYLQTEGNNGPRNIWYARTSAIRTERTPAPVSTHQPTHHAVHFDAKIGKRNGVCSWRRSDDDVESAIGGEHVLANDFAKPALQSIAIHRRLPMTGHDDANPRKAERGSARPDREVPGSYDFPLLLDTLDVCAATDALRPRIAQARFTRRRTWTEASQSGASAPSCDDDSTLRGPSAWTCACEIRASGFGACCAGDRWAFPWRTYVRQN